MAAKLRLPLAPVAREPWEVGDERVARARQTIEKRRFTDVGPADDGYFRRHEAASGLGAAYAANVARKAKADALERLSGLQIQAFG